MLPDEHALLIPRRKRRRARPREAERASVGPKRVIRIRRLRDEIQTLRLHAWMDDNRRKVEA